MALSTIPNNMQAPLTFTQMPAGTVIQVVTYTPSGAVTFSSTTMG